jgi:hypothetical protein
VFPCAGGSIARFATRNRPDDPGKRRSVDAPAGRSQEELWSACIADEPELLTDIVNFIASARARIIESPSVVPDDEPKPGSQSPRRK